MTSGLPADAGAPPGRLDDLSGIIVDLYEAALEPGAWVRVMARLAPVLGATGGMFSRLDRTHPRDSTTEFFGLPDHVVAALRCRNIDDDLIWQEGLRREPGAVFRSRDVLSEAALAASAIHQQLAVPARIEYAILAVIENRPEVFVDVGFVRGDRNFDAAEVDLLRRLVSHLRLIADLERRIALGDAGREQALASFDRAGQPLVVLDRSGYVIHINGLARRILDRADGVTLKLGRILFDSLVLQTEFERVLRLAVASTGGDLDPPPQELRVPRRGPGSPLVLSVVACGRAADRAVLPPGAGAMMMIYDADHPRRLPTDRLAWLYRLTPAEVRVCEVLYAAGSIELAAEGLGLTRHTIRSHLKSIYAKLGIASQGQLMQKLANSVWLMEGRGIAPPPD